MPKIIEKISGFKKHTRIEKLVLADASEKEALRLEYEAGYGSSRNKKASRVFIENIGRVGIFSMSEVQRNFDNAELVYGEDRHRQAQELLRDLVKNGNRRPIAGPPSISDIQKLRHSFPNFSEAIDQIEYAAALSALAQNEWFQMTPMLLLGPAGIGKTAFCQAFSKLLKVSFKRLDVSSYSSSAMIAGLSLGWASGHVGEICKLLANSEYGNPLLLLDEIDKTQGNDGCKVEPALLTLLEPESSSTFMDEAIQIQLNCRHILFVATANELDQISNPLLSRFNVVNVEEPNQEQAPKVINSIYKNILATNPWGHRFIDLLSNNVVEHLSGFKPREISSMLKSGLGKAAMRGSEHISINDLPQVDGKKIFKIGFY